VLAVAALALGACGADSGDNEPPAPTRASYVAKTDALCRQSNARTLKLNRELQRAAAGARDDADALKRFAPILRRGYGPVRDNAVAFRAAVPPPADEARIARIAKTYDQQADFVRRLAAAAARGDGRRFATLSAQQQRLVIRARRLARAYGFKECGSSKSDATS
jgi:hypothetical protein